MNPAEVNRYGVGVQVRELHKSFNGLEVLKGISFQVLPGEVFVIMGPSGRAPLETSGGNRAGGA